jgi:hypothetical protein
MQRATLPLCGETILETDKSSIGRREATAARRRLRTREFLFLIKNSLETGVETLRTSG